MKKTLPLIVIFTLTVAALIFVLRNGLFGNELGGSEDTWICKDGQWEKHGNPEENPPAENCGTDLGTFIKEEIARNNNLPSENLTVEVGLVEGTYAKGTVNSVDGGGGIWFAVKEDQGWKLVYDGNGIVTCNIANEHNFPKSVIPGCVDKDTGEFIER